VKSTLQKLLDWFASVWGVVAWSPPPPAFGISAQSVCWNLIKWNNWSSEPFNQVSTNGKQTFTWLTNQSICQ